MTNFQLRHGEAVAIGLALDVVYSAMTGRLEWSDVKLIHDCLGGLGFDISHDALADKATLFEGIEEFREHLGGRLSITMLNAIGHGEEIHEIDSAIMEQAVRWLEKTAAGVRRTARG